MLPDTSSAPGAANQHYAEWDRDTTLEALRRALEAWEKAGCDDCCPTVLDDAMEGLSVEEWERFRRMGLELAMTGQWACDEEAKPL